MEGPCHTEPISVPLCARAKNAPSAGSLVALRRDLRRAELALSIGSPWRAPKASHDSTTAAGQAAERNRRGVETSFSMVGKKPPQAEPQSSGSRGRI